MTASKLGSMLPTVALKHSLVKLSRWHLVVLTLGAFCFSAGTAEMSLQELTSIAPFLVPGEMARQQAKIPKRRWIFPDPVLTLTAENFEAEVRNRNTSIVVGFFSESCRYCKQTLPVFVELAERSRGSQQFGAVDVRAFGEIGRPLGVKHVPVFFVAQPSAGGVVMTKYFGSRTADDVQVWISLHTGIATSGVGLWTRLGWTALHVIIGYLAALLKAFGIEPTDHGSGGGPFSDGGTLGFAGLIVGFVCVPLLSFAIGWLCPAGNVQNTNVAGKKLQ